MNRMRANGFIRISRRMAEKFYNKGKPVLLCPNKLMPGGMWGSGIEIVKNEMIPFSDFVNAFEYYNCNKEVGNKALFWVREE